MKRKLLNLVIRTAVAVSTCSAFAGDKIDVPKVVTKSDAEKILGVPVKDARGRDQNGTGGYYESEWSYHAIEGDKGLYFDVLCAGREARASYSDHVFHAARRWQQIDSYRRSWR